MIEHNSQVYVVCEHKIGLEDEVLAETEKLWEALSFFDFFANKHKDRKYKIDQITIKTIYSSDK